jgi:hypothetical protein
MTAKSQLQAMADMPDNNANPESPILVKSFKVHLDALTSNLKLEVGKRK